MTIPVVWTEQRPTAPWTQCSECAYLMGMVYGEWPTFPAGIYSDAERDALTNMELDRELHRRLGDPSFPVIDDAARRRYGIALQPINPAGASATELRTTLGKPAHGVVLPGSFARFADGHRLRRWQPSFKGGHMIFVVSLGDSRVWWLDPLAPRGYSGEEATVDEAMLFAWKPSDAHVVRIGQLAPLPDAAMQGDPMLSPLKFEPWVVGPNGATVYRTPGGSRLMSLVAGTPIKSLGEVGDPEGHRLVAVSPSPGARAAGYVKRAEIEPTHPGGYPAFDDSMWTQLLSGEPAADCSKAVTDATGRLTRKLDRISDANRGIGQAQGTITSIIAE